MKKVTNNNSTSAAGPNKTAAGAVAATPQHTYRWISVLLVIGHVVETALQIYLIHHYWQLTTRWAAGLAALLTATVAIINAASIIGVRRGLDFADRWFGQCLCYVMHFSLLGMVWRFLKLTFLYDRTDLREFALLRFVQVKTKDPQKISKKEEETINLSDRHTGLFSFGLNCCRTCCSSTHICVVEFHHLLLLFFFDWVFVLKNHFFSSVP
jgi:hypothetical protein